MRGVWCLAAAMLAGSASAQAPIDFNRQIRPILSDACFSCHGPDSQERKAKLRLDNPAGATAKLRRAGHSIVPGKPDESELIRRILTDDPTERMPPEKTRKTVTPEQVALLKQWIREGAPYAEHWAFLPQKRPATPTVKNAAWPRNPIDRFILARLEKEGLTPAPEADRVTLIRRLSLDLTGLPPTPDEVDAYVKDARPDAYEKLVERLFASPHYGERVALDWLDSARFADTHGYHIDAGRDMSRWREYVIDAFQKNLPFDRFTVEQLAGDLIPNATLEQKIASGFNRNHMINFEGGAIPAEYHNAYIVDRVNTTGTVWLGLTLTCAQCHDHKYDPIAQREYYRLYAFFHNVPENGLDGSRGNAAPLLAAPTREQTESLARIERRLAELDQAAKAPLTGWTAAFEKWTQAPRTAAAWERFEPKTFASAGGATLQRQADGSFLATGKNPATETYRFAGPTALARISGLRLEALLHDGKLLGRSANGNVVLTDVRLTVGGKKVDWTGAVADFSQDNFPVASAVDGKAGGGWGVYPKVSEPNTARFACRPIDVPAGAEVTVELVFGAPYANHHFGRVRLALTGDVALGAATLPDAVARALAIPAEKRTPSQRKELEAYFLAEVEPTGTKRRAERAELLREKAAVEKTSTTTMVMAEMAKPRDTFVLTRGEYDKKGEKVTAGVPAFLPSLPAGEPVNRLALAKWLVAPEHPLTARVIVNRYWQMIFGTGLVRTAEDFGSQSEPPSHADLLDWLAVEFREPTPAGLGAAHGWSVRDLLRAIVTSAAYRQSSVVRPESLARDRDNRLLARGPRYRLQAEFIRDQALAASGLLDRRIGGASVFPYQPSGLWQELHSRGDSKNWSAQFFVQSTGKDLYRRTMYTFWKRTSPPPQLATFDAPDRETCTVRRSRTNTPLQALVLMNDPTYVEASRKLAERMMRHSPAAAERIAHGFRLVAARAPTERETAVLRDAVERQLRRYADQPDAAEGLLGVGESPRDATFSARELAAWTLVANVLLNLDEVVTKN